VGRCREEDKILKVRMGKWRWIGQNLRKGNESIEKKYTFGWNQHRARRTGRPKRDWKRTFLKEISKRRQNMERGEDFGGQQCGMEVLHSGAYVPNGSASQWGLCS
jgi:hypothetical protein